MLDLKSRLKSQDTLIKVTVIPLGSVNVLYHNSASGMIMGSVNVC